MLTASLCTAAVFGVFAVWSVKEAYAKPHAKTMHSHLGIMTLFGFLSYAIASVLAFNPFTGEPIASELSRQRLQTTGKILVTMGLSTMMVGIVEFERSWIMMLIWMASLALFVPFLVLDELVIASANKRKEQLQSPAAVDEKKTSVMQM